MQNNVILSFELNQWHIYIYTYKYIDIDVKQCTFLFLFVTIEINCSVCLNSFLIFFSFGFVVISEMSPTNVSNCFWAPLVCFFSLLFLRPKKHELGRREKSIYVLPRHFQGHRLMYKERKNIVVKDIINIDGVVPKGPMAHSLLAFGNQIQKKRKRKKSSQPFLSLSLCP